MKKILVIYLLVVFGCKDDEVKPTDIISRIEVANEGVLADGNTVIEIRAFMPEEVDKRSIKFKVTKGKFLNSQTDTIVVRNAVIIDDELQALALYQVPSTAGDITVSAEPDIVDQEGRYLVYETFTIGKSEADKLSLESSSFSVNNNYGEITISGSVKNSYGRNASNGISILLEDYDSTFSPLGGIFKNQMLSVSSGTITTIYTPGKVDADQYIYIVGTVLNDVGQKTNKTDTIKVYVTNN
ncbi:hypothetical protein AB9P05_19785 [Roseivirga sp. BDSF3-8]|uniref:hypothetical protein n=1 Tax=Roseivirga sp. BDSF3-8 TaxID=3241598 RepID=UPI0035327E37